MILLHTRQNKAACSIQFINTNKKATGVKAPSRKGLCIYWLDTLRKGVVMDFWIKTLILRLFQGWEVEFLLKLQSPCHNNGYRRLGDSPSHLFRVSQSVWDTEQRTEQVNSKSMHGSFGVPPAMHLHLICLTSWLWGRSTGGPIHCYSFFLTM